MSFKQWLRKILGIDENTTTHKIIISNLTEENQKKEIIDFINENTKIEPCQYTSAELLSKGYKKVQSQAGPLFSQLPAITGTMVSASSYRIRLPEGFSVNDLMRLNKNNELTTVIKRGGKGAIVGQTSLISNAPAATVMGVFTVLSVVTSQYFLKEINKNIESIRNRINDMDFFLKEEKRSDIIADIVFLDEAQRDYEYINLNPAYQQAMLTNILSIKKKSNSNINFYSQLITRDLNHFENVGKDKNKIINTLIEISTNINNLKSSTMLYMYSVIMQIVYSENTGNKEYIEKIYYDAQSNSKLYEDMLTCALDTYRNKISEITKKNKIGLIELPWGIAHDIKKGKFNPETFFDHIAIEEDKNVFCRKFLNSINEIKNLNNSQYVICNDDLYMYVE